MTTPRARARTALASALLAVLPVGRAALATPDATAMAAVEARIRRVAQAAVPRTVAIRVEQGGTTLGFGSGAVVSEDGLVLTCAHVTEPGQGGRLVAVWADGTEAELEVLGGIARNDVALARAKGLAGPRPSFPIADAVPALGDWVVALGHPGGPFPDRRPSVAAGKVTALDRAFPIVLGGKEYVDAIQTDVPIFGGNSGGPLVDLDGRLVGINGAILLVGDASVAYPAARVKPLLPAFARGERPAPRRIENLGAAILGLAEELDPEELLDLVADENLRPLLRAFGSRMESEAATPRKPLAPRRLDDLKAAYGAPRGTPAVVAVEHDGVRLGYAVAWARDGDSLLFVAPSHVRTDLPRYDLDLTRGRGGPRTEAVARGVDGEYGIRILVAPRPADGSFDEVPPIRPAPDEETTVGSAVLLLGASAADPVFQGGIVAARDRRVGTERRIPTLGIVRLFQPPHTSPFRPWPAILQVDAPLDADEMGAAVVRPDGRLVGIAVAHAHRGATMVVPARVVAERVARLREGQGTPEPPTYGPPPRPAPDRAALAAKAAAKAAAQAVRRWRVYVPTLSGVRRPAAFEERDGRLVLPEDSGAGALDLKAGDALESIAGRPATSASAATASLAATAVGTSVPVVLRRDGAQVTYEADVEADGEERRLVLRAKR